MGEKRIGEKGRGEKGREQKRKRGTGVMGREEQRSKKKVKRKPTSEYSQYFNGRIGNQYRIKWS